MSATAGDARLGPGDVLGGRYRVRALLGAGAMGAVYEVQDDGGQRYAAKTLLGRGLSTLDADSIARFSREARVAAGLKAPNVARVLDADFDRAHDLFFILMELLQGLDLEAQVARSGALHPIAAVRIILQACHGIEAVHAAGIVHRDIKPSNLFLHHGEGGEVTVKVCDFGIAKVLDSDENLTSSGALLGTPLFMSPEQAVNSKRVDGRTDVWSVAMSLYYALAGAAAFSRCKTFPELVQALHMQDVPALQDLAPWVDPDLACVVHGALLRDPAARCPSASALADSLMPFAGGSDRMTQAALVGVPAEMRATPARRATLPTSWKLRRFSMTPPGAPEPFDDPLVGTRLAGRYDVLRVIGRGGMGTVYEARDRDGTMVAIKAIRFDHAMKRTDASRRFMREARALTAIKSPYVVRVLDVDTDLERDLPFIVMELLQGSTVGALVKEHGAMDPAIGARLFAQACEGLAAAHDLGIVHRDIKPSNIFLHELPSGTIVPKICDFGVAKRTAVSETEETTADITHTGNVLGSPAYMSPEQARNAKHVDCRTDVWSLGMSLWEALAGRRPWETCTSVGELILAICTQEVTPLRNRAPWVSQGLAAAVHRALLREPNDRYADMREMGAALAEHASPDLEISRAALMAGFRPVAPPGEAPAEVAVSATSNLARTVTKPGAPPDRKRRRALWVAVGLALSLAGAFGLRKALFPSSAPPSSVVVAEPAPPPAAASPSASAVQAPVSAYVAVRPPTATVLIRGLPAQVVDGGVTVQGIPGEPIEIEAREGSDTVVARVTLGSDGLPTPEVVEVRSRTSAAEVPHGRDGGARQPPEAAAGSAKTATPVASGTPAATPVPATDGHAPPPATTTTPQPVLKW